MTFWDFSARFYDFAEKTNGRAYANMLRITRDLTPDGATILEVAAGTGSISMAVADKSHSVICSDLSEPMLKIAKRKAEKANVNNIRFQICDMFHTGFPDHAFDVVIASQVLHLLEDPAAAVAELQRISSNIVILPNCLLDDIGRFARCKVGVWKLLGFKPQQNFSAQSYRSFLEEIGVPPTTYLIAEGAMPLAIAVWKKPSP